VAQVTRKRLNIPFFRHATFKLPQPRGLLDPTPNTRPIPRHSLHRRDSIMMLRLSFEPTLRLYVLLIISAMLGRGIALVSISLFRMTVYSNIWFSVYHSRLPSQTFPILLEAKSLPTSIVTSPDSTRLNPHARTHQKKLFASRPSLTIETDKHSRGSQLRLAKETSNMTRPLVRV
jgi:hypothetical protein